MNRLLATVKTDIKVQWRNKLYAIGAVVGAIVALGLSQLASVNQLPWVVPSLMLLVVGGTTMLYVAGMIVFERDEGTINAVIVSPLRNREYLASKVLTLTALATLESILMIGGGMLIMSWSAAVPQPNWPILLTGIICMGGIYTLFGILLIARFKSITDFLIPMAGLAVLLQLPFLYFLGVVVHPILLVIPTSAPTMMIYGAFAPLTVWQWVYAVLYTVAQLILLGHLSNLAFKKHVVAKAG